METLDLKFGGVSFLFSEFCEIGDVMTESFKAQLSFSCDFSKIFNLSVDSVDSQVEFFGLHDWVFGGNNFGGLDVVESVDSIFDVVELLFEVIDEGDGDELTPSVADEILFEVVPHDADNPLQVVLVFDLVLAHHLHDVCLGFLFALDVAFVEPLVVTLGNLLETLLQTAHFGFYDIKVVL